MAESQASAFLRAALQEAGFGCNGPIQIDPRPEDPVLDSGSTPSPLPSPITGPIAGLVQNPPELGAMRLRLFELAEPVLLSVEEYKAYWPYVSNIWMSSSTSLPSQGK